MLLAIDTSTSWASLALLDATGTPRAVRSWAVGQQHSVQIFGGIEQVLADGAAQRNDVTAVAVATGPGSFNGLRVAVTVAKTLAFVWGVPLVGVATLDALAQVQNHAHGASRTIFAALEAGRDELYIGWYNLKNDARIVERSGAISIATATERSALGGMLQSDRPVLVTGELTPTHVQELARIFGIATDAPGPGAAFADPLAAPDRAVGVGEIALAQLARGDVADLLALEPMYVRRPNITVSTRHVIPGSPSATTGNA